MRIKEIIQESGAIPKKVYKDDIGGRIIITPDPELSDIDTKFSISYINEKMAKVYGVNARILGYDSHGHQGLLRTDPHLHILQKNKNVGYLNSPLDLNYEQVFNLFSEILESIIQDYTMKSSNKNDIEERKSSSEKSIKDFGGSQVRYSNYLEISKIFRDFDLRVLNAKHKSVSDTQMPL